MLLLPGSPPCPTPKQTVHLAGEGLHSDLFYKAHSQEPSLGSPVSADCCNNPACCRKQTVHLAGEGHHSDRLHKAPGQQPSLGCLVRPERRKGSVVGWRHPSEGKRWVAHLNVVSEMPQLKSQLT